MFSVTEKQNCFICSAPSNFLLIKQNLILLRNNSKTKTIQVRRSYLEVFLVKGFLVKGVLKIYNKFTGEHPCRSVISVKLLCNFIEITLRHGCSRVNLLHIFRTPFIKNTSEWLLLTSLYLCKNY